MITRVATAALITSVRVNSEPTIVMAPIVSTPAVGRLSFGCSLAKTDRNTLSRAASNGTREPPSRPANTEPTAAITMKTVTIFAVVVPQACSSTVEATDVAFFSSSSGIEPSTPTWSRKYRAMMPTIEKMIDRGSVRPGVRTSPPRYALVL